MNRKIIEPRILKGFRDYLPQVAAPRRAMLEIIERSFVSFGFLPIDTPALEYAEILLGSGSEETDKQLFRFLDNGKRDVALRFDLTVPFARFFASSFQQIGIPFKRYHIAPVWRAEKPQRGRYREFIQCDFDIIGCASAVSDSEIIALASKTLDALSIPHTVRINSRRLLNGLLELVGCKEHLTSVLRAIDKLEKLGEEVVVQELTQVAGLNSQQIEKIFQFIKLSATTIEREKLSIKLTEILSGSQIGLEGVNEIAQVSRFLEAYGITNEKVQVDLSIARGLGYYTGIVFETTFLDLPEIGSICSGGRYDDLASNYTKQKFPGVGASFGLDRILAAFEELDRVPKVSSAEILLTNLDQGYEEGVIKLANMFRAEGIRVEVYPEVSKLSSQLKYADRRGIPFVVICGEREFNENRFILKNMSSGEQHAALSSLEVVSRVCAHSKSK